MKTLRFAVLTAVALGCHFDKLFQPSGGGHAPPVGSTQSRLSFTTQPDSTQMKDSTIQPPVQVTAFDSAGNVVTSFTGTVTVAIGHNGGLVSGGRLTGTTDVAAVNGVATFANLRIDQIGTGYTLAAAAAPLAGDASRAFDVTATPPPPGPATRLAFAVEPTNTAPGAMISPPVQVAAVDDRNNTVTTFSGTISIKIGHDGSLLGATLNGTKDVPAVNGVATFSNLSINDLSVTYYTLVASNAQLGDSIESGHFTVP